MFGIVRLGEGALLCCVAPFVVAAFVDSLSLASSEGCGVGGLPLGMFNAGSAGPCSGSGAPF
jgi:hypothetical protein